MSLTSQTLNWRIRRGAIRTVAIAIAALTVLSGCATLQVPALPQTNKVAATVCHGEMTWLFSSDKPKITPIPRPSVQLQSSAFVEEFKTKLTAAGINITFLQLCNLDAPVPAGSVGVFLDFLAIGKAFGEPAVMSSVYLRDPAGKKVLYRLTKAWLAGPWSSGPKGEADEAARTLIEKIRNQ